MKNKDIGSHQILDTCTKLWALAKILIKYNPLLQAIRYNIVSQHYIRFLLDIHLYHIIQYCLIYLTYSYQNFENYKFISLGP